MGNLHPKSLKKKSRDWKYILFKKGMPYWLVGILLGVANVIYLMVTGSAFGISSGFLYWGAGVLEKLGFEPNTWFYVQRYSKVQHFFINEYTLLIIFIGLGSIIATLLASEYKKKKIKSRRQGILALCGGILMGVGTRLGMGCNIGALLSGISSLSLHGWIFALFMFAGAIIGSKILLRSLRNQ